jgi:phosphatidylserine decarboxylase
MRLHREGRDTLIVVALAGALINLLTLRFNRALLILTAPLSVAAWGFFAWFFRDPDRVTPIAPGTVYSPADGTIVAIEPVTENEYFKVDRLKVSIYMSPLNVHLNRVPVTGEVRYTHYHPGKYLVAFHPKASELNERNTVVFADAAGRELLVRQIAGFLARRIVSYMQPGEPVTAGEELGFIKFGSRCDVFLPLDATVLVSLDQRVRGGETAIAQLT